MESLPHDVVFHHIFHRLDFTSKVRLAAVCRSWRDLLSHRLSPDLPWLCVSQPPSSPSGSGAEFSVIDLSSPTTACRPRIPIDDDDLAGSNGPYLILARTLSIYNTLTGESIALPKTATRNSRCTRFPIPLPLRMARLSCPPTSKPGECVVAATDKDGYPYVCRLGVDDDWVRVWGLLWQVTFRGRKIFCTCPVGFHRVNMDRPEEDSLMRISPKPFCDRNFVASYVVESCGELLLVTLYRPCWMPRDDSTIKFRVHRWEEKPEVEEEFVRVHDLGDRMLFIGNGCSRSWSGKGSDDGFFTKNCIYYVPPSRISPDHHHQSSEPPSSYRLWKFYVNENDHVGPVLYPHPILSATTPMWITLGTN